MADPEHPGDPEVSGEPSEGRRAPPPLPVPPLAEQSNRKLSS